ncbi:DUF4783 domain-containing protein [Saccharicrinis aurantiacus]|uniref:DUF4783 domain-containing protein n=1 Tax=Saccharicrinis aurantiacus TaxID=1849719 RepID=UPI0024929B2D|nr:DUF4783 domain-containing protein [Saccharicrinis aurantiacus]
MTNLNFRIHTPLLVILLLMGITIESSAQFPTEITKATQSANSPELSEYFNSKIELVLPEKSGVFSKEQAQLVMSSFFKNNPAQSFKIIHQSNRQSSSFAIGKYKTQNNIFRFYFLTKTTEDKTFIHQLRIEQEDD